ncbi:MAG: Gfo/Idh/MocA family oxidoreductase [Verrucomicrobiales bacterium]|nr:Gfo/Idh/MocA family oxidoreductase [Verrucomicrobiales bacterium]MED5585155.1 Gfo/Idh/MocA family oxidoreductase [Verrucomicrobiota bacterium]
MKDNIQLGIVGLGNMGRAHRQNILDGKLSGIDLKAVCDIPQGLPEKREGESQFTDVGAMISSGEIDAIHICTPHPSHREIGVEALKAGLHVLMEKPLAVHKGDCQALIDAYDATGREKVFAAMFNQRTDPHYKILKEKIDSGETGKVRRVHWSVTDWFRTEYYYALGGWRATWKGEGGGVLLNQCPHNLDLFQWLFGMPEQVTGFLNFGRYHQIEVEDDATLYFRYPDGSNATFITSTGEAPGINRLEVIAERGTLTVDEGIIRWEQNDIDASTFSDTAESGFAKPETKLVEIPIDGHGGQHVEILQNFADAILNGAELISPATEGIHSVELANAALLSAWKKITVTLPMDAAEYAEILSHKANTSTFKKKDIKAAATATADDFAKSNKA